MIKRIQKPIEHTTQMFCDICNREILQNDPMVGYMTGFSRMIIDFNPNEINNVYNNINVKFNMDICTSCMYSNADLIRVIDKCIMGLKALKKVENK